MAQNKVITRDAQSYEDSLASFPWPSMSRRCSVRDVLSLMTVLPRSVRHQQGTLTPTTGALWRGTAWLTANQHQTVWRILFWALARYTNKLRDHRHRFPLNSINMWRPINHESVTWLVRAGDPARQSSSWSVKVNYDSYHATRRSSMHHACVPRIS